MLRQTTNLNGLGPEARSSDACDKEAVPGHTSQAFEFPTWFLLTGSALSGPSIMHALASPFRSQGASGASFSGLCPSVPSGQFMLGINAMIAHILLLLLQRYVHDFFETGFASTACHCRLYLLELMQLLGIELSVEKTPLLAFIMPVLGLELCSSAAEVLACSFDQDKLKVWVHLLEQLLDASTMGSVEVPALAGKLAFACWAVGGPMMRSRLACLFKLSARKAVDRGRLESDIRFLLAFLQNKSTRRLIRLRPPVAQPAILFSDATGKGGCGAVLLLDGLGSALSAAGSVPDAWRAVLAPRRTQVTPFELLAPFAAAYTWRWLLRGRTVAIFIDNAAALGMLRKGVCSKEDLNTAVHKIWCFLHDWDIEPSLYRVPSKYNCSDPPSRGARCPFGAEPVVLEWLHD